MASDSDSKPGQGNVATIMGALGGLLVGVAAILTILHEIYSGHQTADKQNVPQSPAVQQHTPAAAAVANPATTAPASVVPAGMRFRIAGTVSTAGQNAYASSFTQFLRSEIEKAGLADQASGTGLKATITDLNAEVVPNASGNVWTGTAIVAPAATDSGLPARLDLKQSCHATGNDRNDASLNALSAVAETLVSRLRAYAGGRQDNAKCPS